MKIVWLINIILPRIADKMSMECKHVGGGWLTGISNALLETDDIDLYVCSPRSDIDLSIIQKVEEHLYCCMFPEQDDHVYDENLKVEFIDILQKISPDLVHAFGTEYPRTLSMSEAADACSVPFVISITGMLTPSAKKYYGSVPEKYYRINFVRDILANMTHTSTLGRGKKDFLRRSEFEVKAIKQCKNVIGRTSWDNACTYLMNPQRKYYKCNESLRDFFYTSKWAYHACIKHSIMVPQMGYPIKGFEVFLEGLKIIKKYYPDVRVFIPGWNRFFMADGWKRKLSIWISDYDYYLSKIISKYELWENLVFCGPLSEIEMGQRMLASNVFVLPSAIENSPNSMGEAMLMGVPSVVSGVGGVQDLIADKREGFIYPYNEPYMMAYYVMQIFSDIDMANRISKAAIKRAEVLYDRKANANNLKSIYLQIKNDEGSSAEV